jgi:hypothetical protein
MDYTYRPHVLPTLSYCRQLPKKQDADRSCQHTQHYLNLFTFPSVLFLS